MDIKKATRRYERWLARYMPLVADDVALKHRQMASAPFPYLRATFYRWLQVWPQGCPSLVSAPTVLAVGDLHVENFGTWRDEEGRLVWGVNDFDEAAHLPYPLDLVRLAASAHLAIEANHLTVTQAESVSAILEGYQQGLAAGGRPFVLAEQHPWLRVIATSALRDPADYWHKMAASPALKGDPPESALVALQHDWPAAGAPFDLRHRIAGLGSLGRPRILALGEWLGGHVAREAKALAPSAAAWASERDDAPEVLYQAILDRSVRCRDPFVRLQGQWIVRRLAPDCSRIELASLPKERDEARLLHAMGWETANIHLGSDKAVRAVRKHLKELKPGWLMDASSAMAEATFADWKVWKGVAPP